MSEFYLHYVAGDTGPDITFQVKRGDTIIPFDSVDTVELLIHDTSLRSHPQTNIGHSQCAVVDAPTSTVKYSFAEHDIDNAAVHLCDLKITYDDGRDETDPAYGVIHTRPGGGAVS